MLKGLIKAKSCAAWIHFVLSRLHSRSSSSHARFLTIHQIEIVKTAVSEKKSTRAWAMRSRVSAPPRCTGLLCVVTTVLDLGLAATAYQCRRQTINRSFSLQRA